MIAGFALAAAVAAVAAPLTQSAGISVLTVPPGAALRVVTAHDRVPGRERLSAMARRHDAVAGVNGGFFGTGAPDAGDPTGLVVADGQVLSEPVGARTALLVPKDGPPRIASLRWAGRVTVGGRTRVVDGVNRNRGRIPACGGVGGDVPTQRIDPSRTCTDASELVVLTPAFAGPRPVGGRTVRVRGGDVLTGSGDAARFLAPVHAGGAVEIDLALREGHARVDPADYTAILGGAPRLVRRGRVHVTASAEGRGADTGRAARTVVAVRTDGTVLLIVIDRATLRGAARTARRLGAVDAVGLDSGGSTTMTVGSRVVNHPSDPGGERTVADGLVILPRP